MTDHHYAEDFVVIQDDSTDYELVPTVEKVSPKNDPTIVKKELSPNVEEVSIEKKDETFTFICYTMKSVRNDETTEERIEVPISLFDSDKNFKKSFEDIFKIGYTRTCFPRYVIEWIFEFLKTGESPVEYNSILPLYRLFASNGRFRYSLH